ncbi:hypothetical protein [Paenibacillus alvei]|uniref:hypothetical protein n=1 Tax=Paenibacillus alvei TaxID=44250 RepID=UPI00227EEB28|nr:hypothetical protein [Paenibacillus alvei]
MNYKYDEEAYAKYLLEHGFMTNSHNYELKILVKYLKYLGFKPKERKQWLLDFCEKHMEGYDYVKHYKLINSVLAYGSKKTNQLIVIKSMDVTEDEMDFIGNTGLDESHQKVLLSLLVLHKVKVEICRICFDKDSIQNHFGGTKKAYRELAETAGLPSKQKINAIINECSNTGLLTVLDRGKIQLSFLDLIGTRSANTVLTVNSFDNIGDYLDYYNGSKRIGTCHNCGKLIRLTSNRMKHCKACALELERLQTRARVEKFRQQKNA